MGVLRHLRTEDHGLKSSHYADMTSYRQQGDGMGYSHDYHHTSHNKPRDYFTSNYSEFPSNGGHHSFTRIDECDDISYGMDNRGLGYSPLCVGDANRTVVGPTKHEVISSGHSEHGHEQAKFGEEHSYRGMLSNQGISSAHSSYPSSLWGHDYQFNSKEKESEWRPNVGMNDRGRSSDRDGTNWLTGLMEQTEGSGDYSNYYPSTSISGSRELNFLHQETERRSAGLIQQPYPRTSASSSRYLPSQHVDSRHYRPTNQPRSRSHVSSGIETQRYLIQQQQPVGGYHQGTYETAGGVRSHLRSQPTFARPLRSQSNGGVQPPQQSPPTFSQGLPPTQSRTPQVEIARDLELEATIYNHAKAILAETAKRCLKSVELANALRDRIGKDALSRTKCVYGGLLVLLELYSETFAVHRIPKNDQVELLVPPSPSSPQSPVSDSGTLSTSPTLVTHPISQLPQPASQPNSQPESRCLFISDIPESVSGNQLWTDFGGQNVVEKVSIDFQGTKKTGMVWFRSSNIARASLKSPMLAKWRNVLSLAPEGCVPPTPVATDASQSTQDQEHPGSPSGTSTPLTTVHEHNSEGHAPLSTQAGSSENGLVEEHNQTATDPPLAYSDQSVAFGKTSAVRAVSPPPGLLLEPESPKLTVSSNSVAAPPSSPLKHTDSSGSADKEKSSQPLVSPRGTFRRAAPAPIITSMMEGKENESSPSGYASSPLSTPGGTPHFAFTFFDDSSAEGLTILPREQLPQAVHDVMNTLCDTYYVPQKRWEKNQIGDYLFCQAITDILTNQCGDSFVPMTKLKQLLRRKFGGGIRIGPLKALVQAYPDNFEVDRSANMVRSLKTKLPFLDIAVITDSTR
eukprot:CAMPEP_0185027992 /NCGR_PEP_ID=MMETSP1103-20130426/13391_1 /TAXON_ID=36769 /ORGANISM="Paraphysomonas bandaiensis, Strain Caron Lab Isolate" /LENGTH=853 /DNA_ID=CAMNT_0027562217 /DNA_START=142 /DNA_END=2703 /DNA_ORIENTATION=-